jgi:hypothetical protein
MLIKYVQLTKGDVLELGAGPSSTPLLHWLCRDKKLVTYEDTQHYFDYARQFRWKKHSIRKVEDWDSIPVDRHWGVVFVDHSPPEQRGKDIIKFKDSADYIIAHDSDERCYGYEEAFKHFKYRYDWKETLPWTTVLSNFKVL